MKLQKLFVFTGQTPESDQSGGVADTEGPVAEGVSFVGMKARPVSSFMEQVCQSVSVTQSLEVRGDTCFELLFFLHTRFLQSLCLPIVY